MVTDVVDVEVAPSLEAVEMERLKAELEEAKARYLELQQQYHDRADTPEQPLRTRAIISPSPALAGDAGHESKPALEGKLDTLTSHIASRPAEKIKKKGWLATGTVMLYELQQQAIERRGLSRSVSFVSSRSRHTNPKSEASPGVTSPRAAATMQQAPNQQHDEVPTADDLHSKPLQDAVDAIMQLDAVQSEQLARSLRMRAEIAAEELMSHSKTSVSAGKDRRGTSMSSRGHATGYGVCRELSRGPMDTIASTLAKTLASSTSTIKDSRMLPSLRKDFARAIALVTDYDSTVVGAAAYMTRMAEAVRFFHEIRDSLHGVVAECVATALEAVEKAASLAAHSPSDLVDATMKNAAANTVNSRQLISALFLGFRTAVWRKLLIAVNKEAGEAVRLLLRCRAFIAQLENRLQQVQDATFSEPGQGVERATAVRSFGEALGSASVGALDEGLGSAPRARARLGSIASSFLSIAGTGKPDENPIAGHARRLAEEDAALVHGALIRVCKYRAAVATEKERDRPMVDTMVHVASIGGVQSPARIKGAQTVVSAFSPVSPLLVANAAPSLPSSGREPPYNPTAPAPWKEVDPEVDALEFIRFTDAYAALVASPVPSAPPVAEEDLLHVEDIPGKDMLSQMVLEHNISVESATQPMRTHLWLVWRHALIRYGFHTRQRASDGIRDLWTSLVIPSRPRRAPEAFLLSRTKDTYIADLSSGSSDKLTADAHMGLIIYRILEAAALCHLFPIS